MNKNDKMHERIKRALERKPISINDYNQLPRYVIGRNKRSVRPTPINIPPPVQTFPPPPAIKANTVYISGSCVGISGYDNLVFETISGLCAMDLDVRINANSSLNYEHCPLPFRNIHMIKPDNAWELVIAPPCDLHSRQINSKSIILTMWETEQLDKDWVRHINNGNIVCVPSQWAIDCFRKNGVKIPIVKIPLGYNHMIFSNFNNFPKTLTFGTAASLSSGGLRKNTGYIIDLFQKTFPNQENVKLKVKITPSSSLPNCNDPRVEINRQFLSNTELAEWYKSISVFVNASYAEGFGLHLIESMASGRPIISTAYSAVTEYFNNDVGWTVEHEMISAVGGAYFGNWGKPITESLIENMKYVYDNQHEIVTKGENAGFQARNFTWKNFGQKLTKTIMGVIK